MEEEKKEEEAIIVSDYIKVDKNEVIKTEAYYCTKLGQVKGVLTMLASYMQFDPVQCQENEYLED